MRSVDSDCVLVFNGEIFNYVELREELLGLGHRFTSRGDTEVILHAYEQWGQACVERLNGMFAFVIHDPKNDRTLLARDRYGIKPLYIAKSGGLLIFASEPIAILRTGLVSPSVDDASVLEYLRYGVTDTGSRTFFSTIEQLRPGSLCIVEHGQARIQSWYCLPSSAGSAIGGPEQGDAVRAFFSHLERSVRVRTRSDVPLSVLMSGGVDSTTIATLAARALGSAKVRSFLVSFPGSPVDESLLAKLAADGIGIPITIEPAPAIARDVLVRCIRDQGEPVISPSVIAQWIVMRAVSRHGIRVALTGQGSDEVLGGYEYLEAYALADAVRRGQVGRVARHVLSRGNESRLLSTLAQVAFVLLPNQAKLLRWHKPWIRRKLRQRSTEYEDDLARCDSLRDMIRFHIVRRLPELLRYEDRNSMAFSVETREPFLDHELVEFALGLPDEMLIGANGRKQILRKAIEPIVPREILAPRRKIGFETPSAWLETDEFRREYQELCDTAPALFRQWIDLVKVRRWANRRLNPNRQKDLWRVYNLLIWHRELVQPLLAREPMVSA